jgi:hypothetical protein
MSEWHEIRKVRMWESKIAVQHTLGCSASLATSHKSPASNKYFVFFVFLCLYFATFLSQFSLWNSGYSPRGEHGSDSVAPTQDIGGIGPFRWGRKPECPEETTGTWSAPKIPFIRCSISSAASWDRTHTLTQTLVTGLWVRHVRRAVKRSATTYPKCWRNDKWVDLPSMSNSEPAAHKPQK